MNRGRGSVPKIEVEIRDEDHPHYRCRGHIVESDEGTIRVHTMFGKTMVRVELEDCKHGTEACFVEQKRGALHVWNLPGVSRG